jgi:hypothetical protein
MANITQQRILDELDLSGGPDIVTNPFSGVEVELDAQGVALYDFIKGCEINGSYKDFDQARYLFSDLYPDAYMKLID